jgi:hypothetical protein
MTLSRRWKLALMLTLVAASLGLSGYSFFRSRHRIVIEKIVEKPVDRIVERVVEKPVPIPCPPAEKTQGHKASAPTLPVDLPKKSQDNSVHIEKGSTVDQKSSGDCSPNIIGGSSTVNCAPPPIEMKWNAKKVDPPQLPRDKRTFRYQQQVTVKVTAPYTPISIGVRCSADIGEIEGFLPGAHERLFPREGTDRDNTKLGFVYWEGSPATPDEPLIISIWSDQPLSVLEVGPAKINVN